jgi:uncharacterized membrane protein YjjP (DUF1212 family)
MDWKGILAIIILGSLGGITRIILAKEGFVSFAFFIGEALLGAFTALIIGLLLNEYSSLADNTIYAICGISGVMARDLLPFLMRVINRKIDNMVEDKKWK